MSTFDGIVEDIPGISIDRFEYKNISSEYFFLSHCHSDHTKGLYNNLDIEGKIVLSKVSAEFLKNEFDKLESQFFIINDGGKLMLIYFFNN